MTSCLWKPCVCEVYDDIVGWDAACRTTLHARRSPVHLLGSTSPGDSGVPQASHPSDGQLEATVFGWLPKEEARAVRAHAATCPRCSAALRRDEGVHHRLVLLRGGEPPIDVADRVLKRLDRLARPRPLHKPARGVLLALSLVVAGLLVASNGTVRRKVRRLGALLVV
jgi:anti-sigma factor RsiW